MFRRRFFSQPAQYQLTEASFDNGLIDTRISFVVTARHAAVLAEPAEAALDDPASGQHHEAFSAERGPDYLHAQTQRRDSRGHQRPLLAGVGPKQLQLRGSCPSRSHHGSGPDGVLHAGRLHQHGQRQALRIDDDMALTTSYLLARVVAVPPLLLPVRTDTTANR